MEILVKVLETLFNGISIGSVLLIAALGLAIAFGLMGVINMAHGELIMLGAYTTYVVQIAAKPFENSYIIDIFQTIRISFYDLYIILAIPLAFLVTALVGLVLEKGVIRHLYGRPLETLLATWGVSLILQQFIRSVNLVLAISLAIFCLLFFGATWILQRLDRITAWTKPGLLALSTGIAVATGWFLAQTYKLAVTKPWFGAQGVAVTAPKWLRGGVELGFQLPYTRLFIIGLTALCVLGIYLFLQRSSWGLRMRAVTQNRNMSACLGIPTKTVDALTFALGSGLAGIAGVAVSLIGSVSPNTGQDYIVETFMVVVVGGVGKLVGSIVGAMAIGIASYIIGSGILIPLFSFAPPLVEFFKVFADANMAKVMVFILIVIFLQVKPTGLFPEKGRTVDA
nr:urea ABC transporter permease subunit UrtB [Pseudanabaena sp. PCC 6802]